jgi:hypothetical protein
MARAKEYAAAGKYHTRENPSICLMEVATTQKRAKVIEPREIKNLPAIMFLSAHKRYEPKPSS